MCANIIILSFEIGHKLIVIYSKFIDVRRREFNHTLTNKAIIPNRTDNFSIFYTASPIPNK